MARFSRDFVSQDSKMPRALAHSLRSFARLLGIFSSCSTKHSRTRQELSENSQNFGSTPKLIRDPIILPKKARTPRRTTGRTLSSQMTYFNHSLKTPRARTTLARLHTSSTTHSRDSTSSDDTREDSNELRRHSTKDTTRQDHGQALRAWSNNFDK